MKKVFLVLLLFSILSCGKQNPESNLGEEKLQSENWYKNLVIQLEEQLGFDFKIEKSDLKSDILI